MMEAIQQRVQVPVSYQGFRLDQAAAKLFPGFSRSRLQTWIKTAALRVNSSVAKPRDKLLGGEWLTLEVVLEVQGEWQAEDIALDIVFEDEEILVLNKSANIVVHPAAGNYSGTVLNALLHRIPELNTVPRAGIVHRLDKDTTGLMVVAKTLTAHTHLVSQLQARSVSREYEAVVQGVMTAGGTVNALIGRHPRQRKKMAVLSSGGKDAVTHYRVLQRFSDHTHIRVKLETGRTHQIRVHMSHSGYPLVGDRVYAGRCKIPKGNNHELIDMLRKFPRQALHAARLGLIHPASQQFMEWSVSLPEDMLELLHILKES